MALTSPGSLLHLQERGDPPPRDGEIRVKVSACGVCRSELHVVDAELPGIKYPIVPGHEIVGRVDLVGANVTSHWIGDRVGIPWLGYTCGVCRFCREGIENLCDRPLFTGYTRDGGFATHATVSYWRGRFAWRAWPLAILLVVTVLLQLWVQYELNFWNRDFFNAIGRNDAAEAGQNASRSQPAFATRTG